MAAGSERPCSHCGNPLPADSHPRRLYCDSNCYRAALAERRKSGRGAWSLELARRRKLNVAVYVRRGLTTREIAKRVGLSEVRVGAIRRELGIPSRAHRKTRFQPWNPGKDPRVGRMTRLWQKGWSDPRIAVDLGVTPGTIYAWRKRLGIPPANKQAATLAAINGTVTIRDLAQRTERDRRQVLYDVRRLEEQGLVRVTGRYRMAISRIEFDADGRKFGGRPKTAETAL
ncbi:MAG: helix-turn-helix domain-containing protein [Gemmatimonadetes bacterium]|nr:helix-turn-helix domain-containing protein [Gemmatimonadota bacterium]